MTASTTHTIADGIARRLRAADYVTITDWYAPDVLLDMNLPTWRFQLQGRDAARQYLVEQTGGLRNLRCTHLRELSADDAVVVESECRFDGDDGEYLWRAIDVFRVVGDEIVEHAQYCTGCWTPADVARQAAEAPMVRW